MVYISDMKEGQRIDGVYYCREKLLQKNKHGKDYYALQLQDKTDVIPAKVWDITPQIGEFKSGDYVRVTGDIGLFNDHPQMRVTSLRKVDPSQVNVADFVKASKRDPEEMYAEVMDRIANIRDPYLRAVAEYFYRNEKLRRKILVHPAAKSVHHSYLGGYLEHVLGVTAIADFIARQYEDIDVDMVVTGALLHDIGKLWELTPMPAEYTDQGQLLGHITIGYAKVGEAIRSIPDFPVQKAVLLEHMILSHHGELEFGAPKVPMTREAMILHIADNADAKINIMTDVIRKDRTDGSWTGYNRFLERYLYKGEVPEEQPEALTQMALGDDDGYFSGTDRN